MLQALIGPLAGLASSFVEGQVSKQKAKSHLRQTEAEARAEIMKTAATHDSKWELVMAESTKNSWKDEVISIIVLIPVCLVFIPGMEDVAKNGFDRLNELPEWYQNVLYVTILAGLGLKGVDKFKKK